MWSPSARAGESSQEYIPVAFTTALQLDPPLVTVTVVPGSPVPSTRGVVSFVDSPEFGVLIVVATGAVVSISTSIILL